MKLYRTIEKKEAPPFIGGFELSSGVEDGGYLSVVKNKKKS